MNTNVQESPSSSNHVCLRNLQEQLPCEMRVEPLIPGCFHDWTILTRSPAGEVQSPVFRSVRFF
jgi:hypothetical protein